MTDLSTILSWFETGDTPTQEQFAQTLSSFRHQETKIPIPEIDGLETSLNNKLNTEDLPENLALVDAGQPKEVYNKEQIRAMTMMLSDYVQDGKIRADKIDALGLTDLIEATENTLAAFVANSNNYSFQKNDFIAIPYAAGNYTLFMFKGGEFSDAKNYLPTGLTSVTIGMVEGLQAALSGKLDQPNADGSYFITQSGETVSYKKINASLQHLLFWDGTELVESNVFQDSINSRLGVGTLSPTEVLHLVGRLRASALVLDENTESLPGQITRSGGRFSGTGSGGVKRGFMYNDYEDFRVLSESMTDAEKTAWKTAMNGGWTTNTMSAYSILPMMIDRNNNNNTYFTIFGANLNFNPISFSVKILGKNGLFEVLEIPNNQVQLNTSGLSLTFYFNASQLPLGDYIVQLWNGVAIYNSVGAFKVTNELNPIDISNNDFVTDKLIINNVNQTFQINHNKVIYNSGSGNAINSAIASAASLQLFTTDDDFSLEIFTHVSYDDWAMPNFFGVSTNQNLSNDFIFKLQTSRSNVINAQGGGAGAEAGTRVIILKQGNNFSYTIFGSSIYQGNESVVLQGGQPMYIKYLFSGTYSGSTRTFEILNLNKLN